MLWFLTMWSQKMLFWIYRETRVETAQRGLLPSLLYSSAQPWWLRWDQVSEADIAQWTGNKKLKMSPHEKYRLPSEILPSLANNSLFFCREKWDLRMMWKVYNRKKLISRNASRYNSGHNSTSKLESYRHFSFWADNFFRQRKNYIQNCRKKLK